MIQELLVGLLLIIILIQIGVLRLDGLLSIFQSTGYESDDELEEYRRKRKRHKHRRSKKDPHMTPITNILPTPDPEDPEEIQRAIMNELNQHDALFLTPSPI
jgi:hypothetical protein